MDYALRHTCFKTHGGWQYRNCNLQKPQKLHINTNNKPKEIVDIVASGEKCATNKDKLIDDTSNVSLKVCPKSQADPDNDVCDAKVEDCKCSVHYEHNEKGEELIKSPGKQESQSENESDESDVVEHDVKVCDICGDAGREDLLAICCRCTDGAEHTYCMREMLEKLPEGDWFCEERQDAVEAENKRPDAEEFFSKRQTLESSKGSSHVLGSSLLPAPAVPKAEARHPDQQSSQLPSDVESVLLQQVLNLTPEQLSSLPPDQQQQVIQLQQALKRDQMQPA
ncbi:hypothetical protein KIW84_042605 [Lathyrus oleraceus]|uniref:Transcription termination and cleavage factor C-terminal domain-containing protein n=1 Tax=Pisum sativum TaxID=3888 RepID=A0A9D5ATK3_PEA|nr:hypothetical protein KIW84_042605 [Pisum sativum]